MSKTCRLEIIRISGDGTFPAEPVVPRTVGDVMEFQLRPGQRVTLGRRGADVLLEAATVSRIAAYVELDEENVTFTDISDHGAHVNGGPRWPLRTPLICGDIIDMFPFRLRFSNDE